MILLISRLNMSFEKDEIVLKPVHRSTAPQTPYCILTTLPLSLHFLYLFIVIRAHNFLKMVPINVFGEYSIGSTHFLTLAL